MYRAFAWYLPTGGREGGVRLWSICLQHPSRLVQRNCKLLPLWAHLLPSSVTKGNRKICRSVNLRISLLERVHEGIAVPALILKFDSPIAQWCIRCRFTSRTGRLLNHFDQKSPALSNLLPFSPRQMALGASAQRRSPVRSSSGTWRSRTLIIAKRALTEPKASLTGWCDARSLPRETQNFDGLIQR